MTNHVIIRLKNHFRENLEIHRILFLIFQKSMKAIKFFILRFLLIWTFSKFILLKKT